MATTQTLTDWRKEWLNHDLTQVDKEAATAALPSGPATRHPMQPPAFAVAGL